MIFKLVKLGILCRSFPQYFKVYNYSINIQLLVQEKRMTIF